MSKDTHYCFRGNHMVPTSEFYYHRPNGKPSSTCKSCQRTYEALRATMGIKSMDAEEREAAMVLIHEELRTKHGMQFKCNKSCCVNIPLMSNPATVPTSSTPQKQYHCEWKHHTVNAEDMLFYKTSEHVNGQPQTKCKACCKLYVKAYRKFKVNRYTGAKHVKQLDKMHNYLKEKHGIVTTKRMHNIQLCAIGNTAHTTEHIAKIEASVPVAFDPATMLNNIPRLLSLLLCMQPDAQLAALMAIPCSETKSDIANKLLTLELNT